MFILCHVTAAACFQGKSEKSKTDEQKMRNVQMLSVFDRKKEETCKFWKQNIKSNFLSILIYIRFRYGQNEDVISG